MTQDIFSGAHLCSKTITKANAMTFYKTSLLVPEADSDNGKEKERGVRYTDMLGWCFHDDIIYCKILKGRKISPKGISGE